MGFTQYALRYGESESNFRCTGREEVDSIRSTQPRKGCSFIGGANGKNIWDSAYVFADFSTDIDQNEIERRMLYSGDDPIDGNIQVWTSKTSAVLGHQQAQFVKKHLDRMPPGPKLFNDDACKANDVVK